MACTPGHVAAPAFTPSGESYWRLRMSTGSSFREAFEQPAETPEGLQKSSASQTIKLLLVPETMSEPVKLALVLHSCGMSLRKAHDTLNRLAKGDHVAAELSAPDATELTHELRRLGVSTFFIRSPDGDPKRAREALGLSQVEFAVRYGLELDTLRNWEQGRSNPDAAARLLFKVIEAHPHLVSSVLTGEDAPRRG
jgi:DNA-binding transcriptional regulator YiaG